MKNLCLFVVPALLVVAQVAHADLDQVAKLIRKDKSTNYSISTKTVNDPIEIEVSNGVKTVAKAVTSPEAFVEAVRRDEKSKIIQSGNLVYTFGWEKLVTSAAPGVPVYDLLKDIKDHQSDASFPPASGLEGSLSETMKPLSIVGPYFSYQVISDDYYPGAAHPNSTNVFVAVDVTKPDASAGGFQTVNLLDLVDEVSLVQALKKDKFLAKLMTAETRRQFLAAKTIGELNEAAGLSLKNCYSFPGYENTVSSYAIYDYDQVANLVSIRIALTAAAHVCAGEAPTVQLGLKVKPLANFEFLLSDQAANKSGLFMKNVR